MDDASVKLLGKLIRADLQSLNYDRGYGAAPRSTAIRL